MSDRLKNIHEMVFIYNAVMDGWTVRKLRDGQIRLKKKTRNRSSSSRRRERHYVSESEQTHLQQYDVNLEEFVRDNTQVEKVFRDFTENE
jgi:hypothetical protein